ncbi:ATP-dependent DNA ligase [Microbacterium sp. STN6]|uniref:ATP-dependent DNA ligase n=1 Tax=Microbacterium sp. STN6 TaxID=2995588 RepID=UPI002260B487|nr:ATP-dependent DNA ligase [Microbacterium sp. STN6]MCX7523113.1 ATP-dependent DNA ligase [Microbacterium sp. STN6]
MAQPKKQTVSVDGHRITLTNLDKVLYPVTGTTKRDVLAYYAEIADVLIPHAADRPLTRKRWVNGVGTPEKPGEVFFQKNLDDSAPSWVKRRSLEHKSRTNEYPLLNDRATLTWLAQIAALELHVPQWRFGPHGKRRNPDRLVLDLDPGEGATLADCAEVARLARGILKDMGLDPMPVTSGSKGIHLYSALDGSQTSDAISAVAHELARALEADHPDLVVSDMKKSLRVGKVLVDWSQNNGAKTTITPYSLRGRFRPTVAVPRTWRELSSPDLAHLEYDEVLRRMKRRADPLAALSEGHVGTPEEVREKVLATSEPAAVDRLMTYRSMRDAAKTPEPVPSAAALPTTGQSFVIQEHHARRLHWDFRLEHDGVLVSWALPKGVPTEPKKNHLAVQTEDHPLEYGSFEGTIPKGEYGAGEVTIWDSGEYELEKWRDGKEVIVTLHGRGDGGLGGPRKVALIHTGGGGRDGEKNWLIHLMKDSPGTSSTRTPEPQSGVSKPSAPSTRVEEPRSGVSKPSAPSAWRRASSARASARASAALSPMLATLGRDSDFAHADEAEWAFEMKWDGIRAIATVDDRGVRLTTRNGNDVTGTYPELVEALPERVAGSAMLDGEIVAVNRAGRPDFGLLQTRMGLTRAADVAKAAPKAPVQYLLFDILEHEGERLTGETYDERRARLFDTVQPAGAIQVPPEIDDGFDVALRSSGELGLEGVMAKRRDSTYSVGRRSKAWVKVKHHRTQEVVIGGWSPGKGRRSGGVGSLLLGIPEGRSLRYVGKVGTGFGDRELDELAARLGKRVRKTSPFADVPRADAAGVTWVTPNLVGEVQFAEWTSTGRLRQPSWRGWRPDKAPDQVVVES